MYERESLETLKQRIDLVELIQQYIPLKRTGTRYVGLCPFHSEKSPSFGVQKGDSHYHCFGCGAHGDAISFLMEHQHLNFAQSVELLAERFHVVLQLASQKEAAANSRFAEQRELLNRAVQFYQYALMHTEEGKAPLRYLYRRGIDLDFAKRFRLGWAPTLPRYIHTLLRADGYSDELMELVGLISQRQSGGIRDVFSERILIPICDARGNVIGFSGRKIREAVFGGKYINTGETPLFKKSRVLFGLHHCRQQIAKQKQAIVVEGQVDALRLIDCGFDITVAAQGTAFGEGHAEELKRMGVQCVYLAFDADHAGREAAVKVGNHFQKRGIEVRVVQLPSGYDPDLFVRERGNSAFEKQLENAQPYLSFLLEHLSEGEDLKIAAVKSRIVYAIAQQIRGWEAPLIVHESLKELAKLSRVPEEMLGVGVSTPKRYEQQRSLVSESNQVDPLRIQESAFIQWLIYSQAERKSYFSLAREYLPTAALKDPLCRHLYEMLLQLEEKDELGVLSITSQLDGEELQLLFSSIVDNGRQKTHTESHFREIIQRLLERNWMEECEALRIQISSGELDDDEALEKLKAYGELRKARPQVIAPQEVK